MVETCSDWLKNTFQGTKQWTEVAIHDEIQAQNHRNKRKVVRAQQGGFMLLKVVSE
jgi:hypothetical protein